MIEYIAAVAVLAGLVYGVVLLVKRLSTKSAAVSAGGNPVAPSPTPKGPIGA